MQMKLLKQVDSTQWEQISELANIYKALPVAGVAKNTLSSSQPPRERLPTNNGKRFFVLVI